MPLKISGTDVKVATATGDATIVNHPARLRQIYVLTSTGSPKIFLKMAVLVGQHFGHKI